MTATGRTIMTAVEHEKQFAQLGYDDIGAGPDQVAALYELALNDLKAAHETIRQLTEALDTNRDIGAAVGILMAHEGLTQVQAFDRLRAASQRQNTKLRVVARNVLYTGTLDRPI
jgi:hypothetical protein